MVISTGATGVSDSVNLTGYTLVGFQMSTGWDDAKIGYKNSIDGSTNFNDVYDTAGTLLTHATTASRFVTVNPATVRGPGFIQLVSETSAGVAVAQTVSRTILLALAEVY